MQSRQQQPQQQQQQQPQQQQQGEEEEGEEEKKREQKGSIRPLSCDFAYTINKTLKGLTQLPTLMQNHSGCDSVTSRC